MSQYLPRRPREAPIVRQTVCHRAERHGSYFKIFVLFETDGNYEALAQGAGEFLLKFAEITPFSFPSFASCLFILVAKVCASKKNVSLCGLVAYRELAERILYVLGLTVCHAAGNVNGVLHGRTALGISYASGFNNSPKRAGATVVRGVSPRQNGIHTARGNNHSLSQ